MRDPDDTVPELPAWLREDLEIPFGMPPLPRPFVGYSTAYHVLHLPVLGGEAAKLYGLLTWLSEDQRGRHGDGTRFAAAGDGWIRERLMWGVNTLKRAREELKAAKLIEVQVYTRGKGHRSLYVYKLPWISEALPFPIAPASKRQRKRVERQKYDLVGLDKDVEPDFGEAPVGSLFEGPTPSDLDGVGPHNPIPFGWGTPSHLDAPPHPNGMGFERGGASKSDAVPASPHVVKENTDERGGGKRAQARETGPPPPVFPQRSATAVLDTPPAEFQPTPEDVAWRRKVCSAMPEEVEWKQTERYREKLRTEAKASWHSPALGWSSGWRTFMLCEYADHKHEWEAQARAAEEMAARETRRKVCSARQRTEVASALQAGQKAIDAMPPAERERLENQARAIVRAKLPGRVRESSQAFQNAVAEEMRLLAREVCDGDAA